MEADLGEQMDTSTFSNIRIDKPQLPTIVEKIELTSENVHTQEL